MIAVLVPAMLGVQMIMHQFVLNDAIGDCWGISGKEFGVKVQIHVSWMKPAASCFKPGIENGTVAERLVKCRHGDCLHACLQFLVCHY